MGRVTSTPRDPVIATIDDTNWHVNSGMKHTHTRRGAASTILAKLDWFDIAVISNVDAHSFLSTKNDRNWEVRDDLFHVRKNTLTQRRGTATVPSCYCFCFCFFFFFFFVYYHYFLFAVFIVVWSGNTSPAVQSIGVSNTGLSVEVRGSTAIPPTVPHHSPAGPPPLARRSRPSARRSRAIHRPVARRSPAVDRESAPRFKSMESWTLTRFE